MSHRIKAGAKIDRPAALGHRLFMLDGSRLASPMTVHEVLAGAYLPGRRNGPFLRHASADGGLTAICGRVAEGNLADAVVGGSPTCKACARRCHLR